MMCIECVLYVLYIYIYVVGVKMVCVGVYHIVLIAIILRSTINENYYANATIRSID
jgi:hypothetical protein